MTGKPCRLDDRRPSENTRRLLAEHGGFLYDRDTLNDELPIGSSGGAPYLLSLFL